MENKLNDKKDNLKPSKIQSNFSVAKSNFLMQQKVKMKLNEQKLIIALASLVQPDDTSFNEHTFEAQHLASMFNITPERMYTELPKITKSIMQKIFSIPEGTDKKGKPQFTQTALLQTATYKTGEGKVVLRFSDKVKPFFLELKEFYTSYKLNKILFASCKYTISLYEALKRLQYHQPNKEIFLSLDEIKETLFVTAKSYNSYSDLRKKAIVPATKEINELSDITVSFIPRKNGRKVIGVCFTVKQKNMKDKKYDEYFNSEKRKELIDKYGIAKVEAAIISVKDNKGIGNYWNYIEGVIIKQSDKESNKQLSFNNFKPTEYDYEKLENALNYGLEENQTFSSLIIKR